MRGLVSKVLWPSLAIPEVCYRCRSQLQTVRKFSTTPIHCRRNRRREAMFRWLNGPGSVFKDPLPGSTNYVSAYDLQGRLIRTKPAKGEEEEKSENGKRAATGLAYEAEKPLPKETEDDMFPFPLNKHFRSEPVLSEELKEAAWDLVTRKGVSVRKVSATYHIDMRRVGAVVRLKEVEKRWEQEGKRIATPYNRAVLAMLPQTPLKSPPVPHESINELLVHKATIHQLYYPVAESRQFTRADAGNAFEKGLLPADERIQHPELIEIDRLRQHGRVADNAINSEWAKAEVKDTEQAASIAARKQRIEDRTRTISTGRWDFKFQDVKVDEASVGRHVPGIGARYGVPPQDRKKGQVNIPTRVD